MRPIGAVLKVVTIRMPLPETLILSGSNRDVDYLSYSRAEKLHRNCPNLKKPCLRGVVMPDGAYIYLLEVDLEEKDVKLDEQSDEELDEELDDESDEESE